MQNVPLGTRGRAPGSSPYNSLQLLVSLELVQNNKTPQNEDINATSKTVKLSEENTGGNLSITVSEMTPHPGRQSGDLGKKRPAPALERKSLFQRGASDQDSEESSHFFKRQRTSTLHQGEVCTANTRTRSRSPPSATEKCGKTLPRPLEAGRKHRCPERGLGPGTWSSRAAAGQAKGGPSGVQRAAP